MIHVALLRAVNLAGRNMVAMADLRALLADMGFTEPRSLLQSGNLVFACDRVSTGELERRLERAAAERLGIDTSFFVRTAAEWRALIEANPFPDEAVSDPGHLIMMALKDAPGRAAVPALRKAIKGRETVQARGREAYVVYPDGVGRSKLTTAVLEKHLGTVGTGRNWNTVLKLGALIES